MQQAEEHFTSLFENMAQGVVYQDREGRIYRANRAAEELLGLTREQLLGRDSVHPDWRAVHPDYSDFPGEEHPAMRALATGREVDDVVMGIYHPLDRSYRWLIVHSVPLFYAGESEPPTDVLTTFEDITSLVEAQAALREQDEKYRTFVQKYPDIIAMFDRDLRYRLAGGDGLRSAGYSPEEMAGRLPGEIFPPDVVALVEPHYRAALAGEDRVFNLELCDKRYVVRVTPIRLDDGSIEEGLVMAQDITLYEQIKASLESTEEKYKTLLNTTGTGYFIADLEGVILDANEEFVRQVDGDSLSAVLSRNILEFVAPVDQQEMRQAIERCVTISTLKNLSIDFVGREEAVTNTILNASVIREGNEQRIMAVTTDITAHKLLEDQLRMESLGTLVLGIGHDFNNILAKIMGHTSLLEGDGEVLSRRQKRSVELIDMAARKGADLVSKLYEFGRPIRQGHGSQDLHQIVSRVFDLFEETSDKLIEKIIDFEPDRYWVRGDYHESFFNLTKNAVDAFEERGVRTGDFIRVTAEEFRRLEPVNSDDPREFVRVEFCNNGPPIPEKSIERIFEPGYSTKPLGTDSGRGFGLAMVYRQVQGRIHVRSHAETGTRFEMLLERGSKENAPRVEKSPPERVDGEETILIVDDEEAIVEFSRETLERSGYTVFSAVNGIEAVELFAAHMESIDLVVFDLTMPRMSGEEAFTAMKMMKPECRFVISTGHHQQHISRRRLQDVDAFIQKPYQARELLQTIRTILDGDDG